MFCGNSIFPQVVSASPENKATKEVLLGIRVEGDAVLVRVASGGCTKKEHFRVNVAYNHDVPQVPMLTFLRIMPDDCKGYSRHGITIRFSLDEIDARHAGEFLVTNKFGWTSQHR